jgi:hypothetical protein
MKGRKPDSPYMAEDWKATALSRRQVPRHRATCEFCWHHTYTPVNGGGRSGVEYQGGVLSVQDVPGNPNQRVPRSFYRALKCCQVPKTGPYTAHYEDKHEVKEKDRQQRLIELLTTSIALQQRTKVAARWKRPLSRASTWCLPSLCPSRTHHCARTHILPDGAGGYKLQGHRLESRESRRKMALAPPRCL